MQSQQQTFYWHDYETWGLSPSLDRPSQFAGIRTDLDFNIIGEPDMFYCRMSNDYLPTVESALITGITPDITQSEGLIEPEFANRINQQFTLPNTCVVGYNSIRFDDEVSRNIFYRNFYDPYEYCWKNGGSRWDIIDLVRAAYALRPEGINWPTNEQGLPSFRLELLTAANGISHENAHDATSDVYATIAIAKLIKQASPKLYSYYLDLRNKNKVRELIDVNKMTPLVHVSGMFGTVRSNISLVAPLVWHPSNSNAVVVVDLANDISPLLELSADEIRERLYTKKDELKGKLPIPLKLVHINKCPFIAIEKTLLPENAERLEINKEYCLKNLEQLQANKQIVDVISEVYAQEKTFDNQGNVDKMLYDGFFSDADKKAFEKIRRALPEKLATLRLSVTDKRFNDLLFNYRARNFPETLSTEEHQQWEKKRHTLLTPLIENYLSMLDEVLIEHRKDQKKLAIINSLQSYVKNLL